METKRKTFILYLLTIAATLILSFVIKSNLSINAFLSNANQTGNYEISDFYNSVGRIISMNEQAFCQDVIIVSTDGCEIEKFPVVIETVESFSPKVIGVDILFNKHADSIDKKIVDAIKKCKLAIIARKADENSKHLIASPVFQNEDALFAVVNVEDPIIRHYWPQFKIGDTLINSFALELVKHYKLEKYNNQINRKKEIEHIRITNDFDCYTIDHKSLLSVDEEGKTMLSDLLKNKIVIIGPSRDDNDMHLTSINKSYPGTAIHAAIIYTILEKEYVKEYPWLNYLIAIAMVFGFAWLVVSFKSKKRFYAFTNLLLRSLQLVILCLGAYLGSLLYIKSHFYLNLSITLLSIGLIFIGYDIAIAINELLIKLINHKKHKK